MSSEVFSNLNNSVLFRRLCFSCEVPFLSVSSRSLSVGKASLRKSNSAGDGLPSMCKAFIRMKHVCIPVRSEEMSDSFYFQYIFFFLSTEEQTAVL